MAKFYEKMSKGENLGWCKPYLDCSGNYGIVVQGDDIIAEYGLTNVCCCYPYGEDGLIATEELHEVGCSECPFRDECEAMNVQ